MPDQRTFQADDKSPARRPGRAPESAPGNEHPLLPLHAQIGNANVARMLEAAQRQADEEDVQATHEKVGAEGGPVGPDTAARIQAMRGSGSPLNPAARASMEASFGTSFRDVRVHTDPQAHMLNRRLSARAFTTGNDIFLRGDASPADSRLLAHELSHVVQQRSMSGSGSGGMRVGPASDAHEHHADAAARALASAGPAQRQADEDELQASHDLTQRQTDTEEDEQSS